jgi:Protein of unknown function (DUF3667)
LSHFKQREEKDCLNCGALIYGKYCHSCGQENIEPKESVWHLISHFFQDITHFDGKFFTSLKYLIFKPGFLSKEYLIGRRARHLNPIRMYVFTSAFFFLIFFSFYQTKKELIKLDVSSSAASLIKDLNKDKEELILVLKDEESKLSKDSINKKIDDINSDIALLQKDSTAKERLKTINYSFNVMSFKDNETKKYKTLKQYDSLQLILPVNKKDGYIMNKIERHNLHLQEKYNHDGRAILQSIKENFIHRFPQMLFTSLPLFALLLALLYARQKNVFYVNHAMFAIHLYCAMFILILISLWLGSIFGWFGTKIPGWLNGIMLLSGFFYLYKGMRNFYGQRRAKTIFKYCLLLFLSLILLTIIFFVFFVFSTFSI